MSKAFSLLEVLVTAVLIALLAVTAYPSLNKMTERQDQQTNLEIMKSCFWRGRVLAGGKPSNAQVSGMVVEYSNDVDDRGCLISERITTYTGNNRTDITLPPKETYPLSNPAKYILTGASFFIANTPPYNVQVLSGSNQIILNQPDSGISSSSFTINVATGTIN